MQTFAARRFLRSAQGEPAEVRITPTGLAVVVAGETSHWPYAELRQHRVPHRGEPALIERAGAAEALHFADAAVLVAIRAASPAAAHIRAASGAPFATRVALVVAVVAAATAGVLFGLLPAFADWLAGRVPIEWEESYGEMVVAQIAGGAAPVEDPAVRGVVDRIARTLSGAADTGGYTYRILLLDRAEVNALAAPGGHIVVFRGMLEHARTPDELAAVLAHEMEHVRRRHVTRGIFRRLSLDVLIAILAGDLGTAGTGVAMARALGDLSFSRGDESEADALGLDRLRAAGFAPEAMPAVLERMSRGGDQPQWAEFLATHPAPRERARRLRERSTAAESAPASHIVTAREWDALRAAVRRDSTTEAAPSRGPDGTRKLR